MSHSFSQSAAVTCSHCRQNFDAAIWLVVDSREHPDLLVRIQAGTLHDLPCPHCGHARQANAPILLYRPDDTPPLIFSPAQGTTEAQDQEQVQGLLGFLHDSLGNTWRDVWLKDLPFIPRAFLPAALSNDPEAAMRQMAMQAEQALAQVREEDPDAYRELEETARKMAEEARQVGSGSEQDSAPATDIDPERAEALADKLIAWMQQETLHAAEAYLQQHEADLLTEEGASVMALLVQMNPGNPIVADQQQWLARAREMGVPALYAAIRQQRLEEAKTAQESVPPAVREVLTELAQSDVVIHSEADLERALAARPDLQAKLAAVSGGGLDVPPQFQADIQQAQMGEQRYVQRGDRGGLDEAITAWQSILDHPNFPTTSKSFQLEVLESQSTVILRRYWDRGQSGDLERAFSLYQMVLQRTPLDSPALPKRLTNLGIVLNTRYMRTKKLADLEAAISAFQTALQNTKLNPQYLPILLNNLGLGLRNRYIHTGQLVDLEDSIHVIRQSVERTPPHSPDLYARLINLSIALLDRYMRIDQPIDLDESIRIIQMVAQHIPTGSPDLPETLNNLGRGLLIRYQRRGQLSDLEEAIQSYEITVQHTPHESPILYVYLNNLGGGLLTRYNHNGQLADLEEGIRVCQMAVQYTPSDSSDLSPNLNNLGNGLRDRYNRTGQLADLEEAIRVYYAAIRSSLPDSLNLPKYFNNLGIALRDRYTHTGQLTDLDEAIHFTRLAIQSTPSDSSQLAFHIHMLGVGLRLRYKCTGQFADLEEAINIYQQALQCTLPDSMGLPNLLNSLAIGLSTRYAIIGQITDLEEAIRISRQAVAATPNESPNLPAHLNNLGGELYLRYIRTGQLADLEEAILIHKTATQCTSPGSPGLPSCLNNLGSVLHSRYDRTRQLDNLEEAIRVWKSAVRLISPDSPDLVELLNNLGNGFQTRYAHTGQLIDLEKAIRIYRRTVEKARPHSPNLSLFLSNLGSGLLVLYNRTGLIADMEESIRISQMVLERTLPDSPYLPSYLGNLGNGLRKRWSQDNRDQKQKEADVIDGSAVFEQACLLGHKREPAVVVKTTRSWGQWALERQAWDEARRAYQYGLTALEQLYQTQLLQHEQQSWQREGQGLYAQAAYALARVENLFAAVVALEQGQARGLNNRLARDEANLLQVQQHSPDLFKQYQEAAGRLRQLEVSERQDRLITDVPHDWADHRQQVQQGRTELQTTIAAIRQLDGYDQFLLPPRFETVSAAVQPGHPFVYLVTTAVGSLALLLHRATTDADVTIEPLWADSFTQAELNAFLVKRENGQLQGGYLPGQFSGGSALRTALAEGLPLLGEKLLAPLAQRLQALELDSITLIPGGRLNLLPLHAAYVPINDQPTPFGEAFTVSYAPSTRTLAASRRRLETHVKQPATLLTVGNPLPLPDGINSLHFARPEAEEIALRFGGTHHLYCETAATHAAVTAAIQGTRYLHFSCHGLFDLEHPLNSGLILSEGVRLTLRQVLDEIPLTGTRLVTLSACQTAVSDFNDLPDEVIGLPAGFLEAGAAGVLGSLWPVDDLSTALFMDHFYQLHWGNGHEPMAPAEALQATQCWLRHLTVGELSQLFAKYKADAPDAPAGRMAYALAQEKFTDFTLAENQKITPYADPYYWAAFAFYGM